MASQPATTAQTAAKADLAVSLPDRQQLLLQLALQQGWEPDSYQYDPSSNVLYSVQGGLSCTADVVMPPAAAPGTAMGSKGSSVKAPQVFQVGVPQSHLRSLTSPQALTHPVEAQVSAVPVTQISKHVPRGAETVHQFTEHWYCSFVLLAARCCAAAGKELQRVREWQRE
jgi:hypothetical protein